MTGITRVVEMAVHTSKSYFKYIFSCWGGNLYSLTHLLSMLGIRMPTENQVDVKTTTGAVTTVGDLSMTEIDGDQDHTLGAVAHTGASEVDMIAEIVATIVIAMIVATEGVKDLPVHAMSLMIMKGVAEDKMSTGGILVIDIQTALGIDLVAALETAAQDDDPDPDPETTIVNAIEKEASIMNK